MLQKIDLNADLGESYGPWSMGDDAAMLKIVTSANIACGGHASDPETMFETLVCARENGVCVGAHPGYLDPMGFGRRVIPMAPAEIGRMVAAQVGALQAMAKLADVPVRYVKAHGALANHAASDAEAAAGYIEAVMRIDPSLIILAISGTQLEHVARKMGAPCVAEIFADRGYLPNGQLVPRDQPSAMIEDPEVAAERLLGFLETGRMPTVGGDAIALDAASICVHGDSPGAVAMAQVLRARLTDAGVILAAFAG
jgi:UPF0271 protein